MKTTGINFFEGNPTGKLAKVTLPLLVSLVLNMVYSLVDSLWIGNMLGEKAMAALTSSTAVILLLTCIFLGMSNGMAILLAQALGAKDEERAKRIAATSFLLFFVLMTVIVILCECSLKPLLLLLKTPEETYLLAVWYLRVYLVGVLPAFFYQYFATILRCYGNTVFQALCILVCTVLNAVLDPIFIKWFGFHGVAAATVLTQTLSLIAAVVFIKKRNCFHFSYGNCDRRTAGLIMGKALPTVIQQSIPAVSTMALTSLVSGFGLSAIAAFGIIGKLENILIYPVMALNMALTAIVGQCVGGKRMDLMRTYVKKGMQWSSISLLLLTGLVILFSRILSNAFVRSEKISEIVAVYFLITGAGYVIHTLTTCFLAGLNGMGQAFASMFLYLFYFLLVRIPAAYFLSEKVNMGLNGIWMAVLVSHFVAVATAFVLYQYFKGKIEVQLHQS